MTTQIKGNKTYAMLQCMPIERGLDEKLYTETRFCCQIPCQNLLKNN